MRRNRPPSSGGFSQRRFSVPAAPPRSPGVSGLPMPSSEPTWPAKPCLRRKCFGGRWSWSSSTANPARLLPGNAQSVSAITVQLLQAASEIAGGDAALAKHLGISERLLARFMAGHRELPDPLLLRAGDIFLGDPQSPAPSASEVAPPLFPGVQNVDR